MERIYRPISEEIRALLVPGADLEGVDLEGVDLAGLDLAGLDLAGAHLEGANLRGAIISNIKVATINSGITDLTSLANNVFAACVTPEGAEEEKGEAKADQDAFEQLRENFIKYQELLAQNNNNTQEPLAQSNSTNITYQAELIEKKIVDVLKKFTPYAIGMFDFIFKGYGDNLTNFITENSRKEGGLAKKMFKAIQLRINLENQKHDSQQLL